jgi:hypothetical protein
MVSRFFIEIFCVLWLQRVNSKKRQSYWCEHSLWVLWVSSTCLPGCVLHHPDLCVQYKVPLISRSFMLGVLETETPGPFYLDLSRDCCVVWHNRGICGCQQHQCMTVQMCNTLVIHSKKRSSYTIVDTGQKIEWARFVIHNCKELPSRE